MPQDTFRNVKLNFSFVVLKKSHSMLHEFAKHSSFIDELQLNALQFSIRFCGKQNSFLRSQNMAFRGSLACDPLQHTSMYQRAEEGLLILKYIRKQTKYNHRLHLEYSFYFSSIEIKFISMLNTN